MTVRSKQPEEGRSDRLFAEPEGRPAAFAFDARVAAVFEDMIRRSVPGYRSVIEGTGVFAARHVRSETRAYDLGCSLGAGMLAVLESVPINDFELIGVDSSQAMIARCRELLRPEFERGNVTLVQDDIRRVSVKNASFVAMNFTLQFIPPAERLAVLRAIREGMVRGGALLLSEKVSERSAEDEAYFRELHEDFKRLQGYSELEIAKKRAALDRVLLPESLSVHQERLRSAGFESTRTWFRCMNFVSIVAYS